MKKNCALPCCLRAGLTVAVKPPVTKPIALTFMLLLLLAACRTDFQPRPKGYNRLQLPQPEYRVTPDSLPYRFEYSIHARLLKDTSQVSEKDWVEIYYPSLGATLHITYKPIGGNTALLKEYLNDAYVLTAKHQVKAYAIDESISRTNASPWRATDASSPSCSTAARPCASPAGTSPSCSTACACSAPWICCANSLCAAS